MQLKICIMIFILLNLNIFTQFLLSEYQNKQINKYINK